jgi:hypothetical protein
MGDIELPPGLFYALGAVLIVFGCLRAYFLGWKQKPPRPLEVSSDDPVTGEGDEGGDAPAASRWSAPRSGGHKRHITFGVVWVVMGLFLVISTVVNTR